MKRNIIRNLFPALVTALVIVSCQVDSVTESTVVTRLEKNVYEVGENVRFHFSGEADFVTIFTGVDNYNGGTMGGTIKGSRYIYRNRGRENGSPVLSFNCKKDGDNLEEYAEIKLLLSTDFDGDITMEGIKRATWLDISEKAKWPVEGTKKGVNVNSGAIDLSEWNGRDIYLAFRYTAKKGQKQEGYTISSFNLNNTVETDALPYTIWTNASFAKCGTTTNKLQEDQTGAIFPAYQWTLGTSLTCAGMPDGKEDFESWVITSPVDPSQVIPDYGTLIKSYSEVVPGFYDYTYYKPGKFTVTVVSRNATAFGTEESVQNIEIEIVENNFLKNTFMKYLFSTLLIACVSVLMSAQPKLNLNTGSIDFEWQQEEDGWHISCIKIDGKQIPAPKGYYTVLYIDRNPAKDLVDQDLEGKDFTFYPSKAEMLPDGTLKFSHSLRFGDVEAIWKVDPLFPSDIKVDMKVRLSTNGSVSIATPTITVFEENNISWAMIPGNWYGNEIQYNLNMAKTYSMGIPCVPMLAQERNTMTLCPLYSSKDGYTLAVIPDPGTETDPIAGKAPDKSPNSLGLSLANRHNELTPVVYHPVLGQVGAKHKAGDEVVFGFRYTLKNSGWFDVFQHAVNDVFALPSSLDLLTNKVSLSERVSRLQKFLRKDKESSWKTWQSRGETIGANGSKIADAGTMFMIARNGQDSVMSSRLHYVRNYKMIQQQTEPGYFCGAALGEYADIDGVESERGNWIEPLHTTYYTMVDFGNMLLFNPDDKELLERLRMAGDRLLAWQKDDGSFEVGYDRFSMKPSFPDLKDYRPTWYGLYIAYKHLKDRKYLDAACKGADWQQENGVDKGYYLGVCGDGRNIWDFCTAQTSRAYMDLYEITGNKAYKQASIDAAMIYATSIFTNPVMTDETKYIGEQAYKDWELNQTGLGVEHIRGTAVNGPILISSYAGLFVKMYEWTEEPVFLTMARAASIGRNAFVDQKSGCAVYYWHGMNELKKYSTMFPWHAYWQIGWIVDYLIAEAGLRSDSNISFPYGYMTPKVGPHVTYGFAPGNIYGKKADLLFRPDMVGCDNPEIEFLTALSENGTKLYLIAMCQSNDSQSCTVTLDLSQLVANKTGFRSAKALQGKIIRSAGKKGQINLDFAPWGMNVIEISL